MQAGCLVLSLRGSGVAQMRPGTAASTNSARNAITGHGAWCNPRRCESPVSLDPVLFLLQVGFDRAGILLPNRRRAYGTRHDLSRADRS